ncbi:MAG: 3-dehydroquinate synthase [Clostridia bacterium]|nr:3-dehydroquinate synthase [Clostridia bacterium]
MKRIHVTASKEYDVLIQRGLLDELGELAKDAVKGRSCMVVTDSNVAPLHLSRAVASLKNAGFTVSTFAFPAGEGSKNGETYLTLVNLLAQKKLTRADLLVALGGGVVGDLTGFAAATFLRGIACIQIPTTLLSCVDSSVGGKTAIDLPAGKNLVGAFYQPNLVICDPDLLDSLPPAIFADGCAEVIKHGMLGRKPLLNHLREKHAREDLEYVIAENVDMKRSVVEGDEFDTGRRQLLNLGHTFAHSIEALSHYQIPHGSAVAMGMRLITNAAIRKGFCPAEVLPVLEELLVKHDLPLHCPYGAEELAEVALLDKKRSGSTLTLAVPCGLGETKLHKIDVSELIDWAKAGLEA